jgi:hypothetical protein
MELIAEKDHTLADELQKVSSITSPQEGAFHPCGLMAITICNLTITSSFCHLGLVTLPPQASVSSPVKMGRNTPASWVRTSLSEGSVRAAVLSQEASGNVGH